MTFGSSHIGVFEEIRYLKIDGLRKITTTKARKFEPKNSTK